MEQFIKIRRWSRGKILIKVKSRKRVKQRERKKKRLPVAIQALDAKYCGRIHDKPIVHLV